MEMILIRWVCVFRRCSSSPQHQGDVRQRNARRHLFPRQRRGPPPLLLCSPLLPSSSHVFVSSLQAEAYRKVAAAVVQKLQELQN